MFDGLLGRSNFKTKCKSALTRTKTRSEVIKKKRNAMQRFLKKDIADLLKTNLDRHAYGRAEGLYMELNLSSCYDYVDECCTCVAGHLTEMHKQSVCVEECKVAVASLIYAAARFADLPELRDLRIQFYDKYGKALEPFVNKEFAEKLKSKPPSMEMKLQLMQDIAQEFSVTWDPGSLEQQLRSPPMSTHDHCANFKSSNDAGNGQFPRTRSVLVQVREKQDDEDLNVMIATKMRHSVSCCALSDRSQDSEDNADRKPFTNRVVPAPYKIILPNNDTEDQNSEKGKINGDEGLVGRAKPRPRSVRTKLLNQSHSTVSSSEPNDIDVKETSSARVAGEVRYYGLRRGEKEMGEENKSPMSESLPLPPGRRRYLFSESPPVSPLKEADSNMKSDHELPLNPGKRRLKSDSFQNDDAFGHVHPKMPDFDELAERVAALRKV